MKSSNFLIHLHFVTFTFLRHGDFTQNAQEKIAERQYELQRAHKLTLIHSVRSRLSVLTVPGGEFESYATRVTTEAGEINDARIGAVLGLARYDVHAAAKYLLMEMKEEDKLKAWRSALKAHIAKLPRTDAPTIGYPKENQLVRSHTGPTVT